MRALAAFLATLALLLTGGMAATAADGPPPGQDVSLSLGVIERATDPVQTTDGIDLKTYAYNDCKSKRTMNVYTGANATGTRIILYPCTRTQVDSDSGVVLYNGFGGCYTSLNGRAMGMGVVNTTWHLDIYWRIYGTYCKKSL